MKVTRTDTRENLGDVEVGSDARRVLLKRKASREPLPDAMSIGPSGPIDSTVIKEALFRYADSQVGNTGEYRAVTSVLRREVPRVKGPVAGDPLLGEGRVQLDAVVKLVLNLDEMRNPAQGGRLLRSKAATNSGAAPVSPAENGQSF